MALAHDEKKARPNSRAFPLLKISFGWINAKNRPLKSAVLFDRAPWQGSLHHGLAGIQAGDDAVVIHVTRRTPRNRLAPQIVDRCNILSVNIPIAVKIQIHFGQQKISLIRGVGSDLHLLF